MIMNITPHLLKVLQEEGEQRARTGAEGIHAYASQMGQCIRQVAYSLLVPNGTKATHNLTTELTFKIGKELHKSVQLAMKRANPSVEVEVPWVMGKVAGFVDGIYVEDGQRVAVEIKTISVSQYRQSAMKGPKREHMLQCAASALALGCTHMHIIYVCKAWQMDVEPILEWFIEVPMDDAQAALEMLEMTVHDVENNMVPERMWDGEIIDKPSDKFSVCRWCSFFERCVADGPGKVPFSGRKYADERR